jgi:hypothetical protein
MDGFLPNAILGLADVLLLGGQAFFLRMILRPIRAGAKILYDESAVN